MMNYGTIRVFALRDCWVNWYLCQHLEPGTFKYKAGVLTSTLCCLVGLKISLYSL
jgi:hypothetical protein